MVEKYMTGHFLVGGKPVSAAAAGEAAAPAEAREKTMAYRILRAHDASNGSSGRRLTFDSLISHDITYVGIIQTARASGMERFPVPYAMTNCHNSLCAVGGTINEDDHAFGLSAARKYGGIFVPPNQAVIHQYARECMAECGNMILGSDSHTRYGSFGSMGVGEGGGELAKQLLGDTWDVAAPEVVLVWLEGKPRRGVGPQDVALSLVAATFPNGDVKNKVLEFAGPGLAGLSADFRIGVEVMTTETSCLTSIWETDGVIEEYYRTVGRPQAYRRLAPGGFAYYDALVRVDLSRVECMIALPFHPSNAVTVHELLADPEGVLGRAEEAANRQLSGAARLDLRRNIAAGGRVACDQGVIVGCSGGMYENIMEAAAILSGKSIGDGYFDLSVYPSSTPIALACAREGAQERLMLAGAVMKPCFCGPCFGAGDTPANDALSIRHATRNFANRDGSKPGEGQVTACALMDARSIAATAANGGFLTAATDVEYAFDPAERPYRYDGSVYGKRVYDGFGRPDARAALRLGPNIRDWPEMRAPEDGLLLRLCAVIHDDVTTTDELIPSGETSSYRSNPIRLSEFALSRRCPAYVGLSKAVAAMDRERAAGGAPAEAAAALAAAGGAAPGGAADALRHVTIGSCVFANKPGDGSAREQAASCQKVLGGYANICYEYATKRYRSNCINWGILPFTIAKGEPFPCQEGDWVYVPRVREAIAQGWGTIPAKAVTAAGEARDLALSLGALTAEERQILLDGCLMNFYKNRNARAAA
jgi:aconitate hydratase